MIISLPIVLAEEYRIDYDANGNIVYDQESNVYREYNELNQLTRTRLNNISGTILQEYTYDPIKERIFIKDEFYENGSLKLSTYYFDDDYIVIQNSSGTYNRTNIYQDGVLVGYEDFDGKKRYVLLDYEGSAHIVLNESGDVIEENLFSPFAEPLEGVKENKFSYEAKEYDSLVQDYDFHFRKYNPNLRIFMQPDTLIENVYDPQSLNRYSFERNNPQKNIDPTGHIFGIDDFVLGVIFIGIAIYSGYQLANQLSAIEESEGGLTAKDTTLAFLNIALIVFPTQGLGQLTTKFGGKQAYKGYFDERIANLEKPEAEKVVIEEGLECGLAVDCQLQVIEGQRQIQGQTPGTPSTPSTSSQADTSKNVNTGSSSSRSSSAGTSSFTSMTPRQTISAAGGSSLKTAAQRAASESLAAKIINKQREVAKKGSKKSGKK